jgi:ParB/RepB/Spo0J family partition protein
MDLKEEIARKRAQANSVDENKNTSARIIDFVSQAQQDPDAVILMVNQIDVKAQGRKTFDDLEALASDIQAAGQLQPVVVKQIDAHRYRLVAGERRYRAITQILKQDTIRATIRKVDESEMDTRFVQLSENTQRDDYLPLELAEELADIKYGSGLTNEQIGSRIGKSKGFVSKYISLLNVPEDVKQAINSGEVTATAWFNNKEQVTQQLNDGQSGSIPPKANKRNATLSISIDVALDIARILQTLSRQKGLADIDVDLSGSVTKKQLQAILSSRTNEVLESL